MALYISTDFSGSLIVALLLMFFCLSINGLEPQLNFQLLDEEQQLKILNKPYVKSIQTKEGYIYDCVDIHKQPAFEHPLLKNHKIQMKPSFSLKRSSNKSFESGIKRLNCPFNTVPIQRTSKEDLIRDKMLRDQNLSMTNFQQINSRIPGFHYATKVLRSSPSVKIFGAGADISVHNPSISEGQRSVAIVLITSNQLESLLTGWMVQPSLFGDNKTHTFALWTDGTHGCVNTRCPGFVQVSKKTPVSFVLDLISVIGGQQYILDFVILKDKKTGDFWLRYQAENIGYWPKQIVKGLQNSITDITWGGEAHSDAINPSPPMGSGHFPDDGEKFAAQIRGIGYMDESRVFQYVHDKDLELQIDNAKCYKLAHYYDHAFFYGGPGGDCGV